MYLDLIFLGRLVHKSAFSKMFKICKFWYQKVISKFAFLNHIFEKKYQKSMEPIRRFKNKVKSPPQILAISALKTVSTTRLARARPTIMAIHTPNSRPIMAQWFLCRPPTCRYALRLPKWTAIRRSSRRQYHWKSAAPNCEIVENLFFFNINFLHFRYV